MGAYQQIYVGPYLRVPKIDGTITHEDKKCVTEGCVSYKRNLKAKICPNCGNKVKWVPRIEKIKTSGFTLTDNELDLWYDTFTFPHNGGTELKDNFDYLLPQDSKELLGVIDVDDNFVGSINLLDNSIAIAEIQKKFMDKYMNFIKKIVEDGGEPEICYGMFIYYS